MLKEELFKTILEDNVPSHVAIIMDGNGRWAKKRLLNRSFGHKAGAKNLKKILKSAKKIGIKYLTVYAFSSENWSRPKQEVNFLMNLLIEFLKSEIQELKENKVRLKTIGNLSMLPEKVLKELNLGIEETKDFDEITLTLALSYGGKNDIKNALMNICEDIKLEKFKIDDIDEDFLKNYLSTSFLPDPDLIIRTGGEKRLSNFLIFESAYSEFYFEEKFWPDFTENELYKAILDFQSRERRFGGLK